MRQLFIQLIIIVSISLSANAQIRLSHTTINYETIAGETEEESLTIYNDYNFEISFECLLSMPEFTSEDNFTVSANSSYELKIAFKPKHNILHKAQLFLRSNTSLGVYLVNLNGQGAYQNTYWAGTQNKSEEALKQELKSIISAGYKNLGYNGARDVMYASIDNINGQVECIYTGRKATFNTRSGANSNSFNTEHIWPQSFFSRREPERADLYHIISCDQSANSTRGNNPYGVVNNATWTEGGSKSGGGLFEPRDEAKGYIARAVFYFVIRYGNAGNFLSNSQEQVLRLWSEAQPVNTKEKNRGDAVYTVQKNRNPFIDHPEFLERITSFSGTSVGPVVKKLEVSNNSIVINQSESSYIHYDSSYKIYLYNTGNTAINIESIKNNNPYFDINYPQASIDASGSIILTINRDSSVLMGNYSQQTDIIEIKTDGGNFSIPIQEILNFKISRKSLKLEQNLEIFPNPVQDILHIKTGSKMSSHSHIDIYNTLGTLEISTEIRLPFTEINLQHLARGLYFVRERGKSGFQKLILN